MLAAKVHAEATDPAVLLLAGKLSMPPGRCMSDHQCRAQGNSYCLPYDDAIVQLGADAIPGGRISKEPICWCKNGNDTCVTDYGVCQDHTPCLVSFC
jgi:hypothetical protein